MDYNLKESRIAIQVPEVRILGQPFEHLINKKEGEIIFLSGFV